MLCDEIIATRVALNSGCDISGMLPRIARAQKFVLGPEFASVCDALAQDYTGLVRAFEHCRLPFPETWIEVVHTDRPEFAKAPMQLPALQIRPKRVGYLLTATRADLGAWKAHLFWSMGESLISCAGLAMRMDMTHPIRVADTSDHPDERDPRPDPLAAFRTHIDTHPGWTNAAESVRLTMLRHTDSEIADYGLPSALGVPPHRMNEFAEIVTQLARSDWAGEVAFVLAVIGLMNARNAIETVTIDNRKLNKARQKRGAPPLFEHKILKIHHRQIRRVYGDGQTSDRAPMRGHFVRGHFKNTKWGIFFWHSHARGDFGRGRIDKDYELT